jgi:hypothetical protein
MVRYHLLSLLSRIFISITCYFFHHGHRPEDFPLAFLDQKAGFYIITVFSTTFQDFFSLGLRVPEAQGSKRDQE